MKSARRGILFTVFVPVLFVGAGCSHASDGGRSSFKFVDDVGVIQGPPADASKLQVAEAMSVIVPPKPLGTPIAPKYPPAALRAHLQDVQVAVSLSIDESGRVVDVERSLVRLPYTTAFQDQFFDAVRAAVVQWTFEPGKLAHLEPQSDGRPLVTGLENRASKLTVAFTFSSSGEVSAK